MFRWLLVWLALSLAAQADETLVAVTAKWCGPCQRFHADLSRDPGLAGGRRVLLVDADRREARRYRARSLPTFILERDGQEIRRTTGYSGPEGLKAWLEGH